LTEVCFAYFDFVYGVIPAKEGMIQSCNPDGGKPKLLDQGEMGAETPDAMPFLKATRR
jgi:hypothetical protein